MWLPRLRFTLVPHSSRSPFQRGFCSFVCLGVFCKFSAQRLSYIFILVKHRERTRSYGRYCPFLSKQLVQNCYPQSDQKERFLSSCAKWAPKIPPPESGQWRGSRFSPVARLPQRWVLCWPCRGTIFLNQTQCQFWKELQKSKRIQLPSPTKKKKKEKKSHLWLAWLKWSLICPFFCFLHFINVHFELNL